MDEPQTDTHQPISTLLWVLYVHVIAEQQYYDTGAGN